MQVPNEELRHGDKRLAWQCMCKWRLTLSFLPNYCLPLNIYWCNYIHTNLRVGCIKNNLENLNLNLCMYTNHLWYSIPQEGASSDRVFEGYYPLSHPHHRHHQILSGLFENIQHKKDIRQKSIWKVKTLELRLLLNPFIPYSQSCASDFSISRYSCENTGRGTATFDRSDASMELWRISSKRVVPSWPA